MFYCSTLPQSAWFLSCTTSLVAVGPLQWVPCCSALQCSGWIGWICAVGYISKESKNLFGTYHQFYSVLLVFTFFEPGDSEIPGPSSSSSAHHPLPVSYPPSQLLPSMWKHLCRMDALSSVNWCSVARPLFFYWKKCTSVTNLRVWDVFPISLV